MSSVCLESWMNNNEIDHQPDGCCRHYCGAHLCMWNERNATVQLRYVSDEMFITLRRRHVNIKIWDICH